MALSIPGKSFEPMYLECPNDNCGKLWNWEEIESQKCNACGYPDNDDDDDEIESRLPTIIKTHY
jgi:Zn ribbon nucleic-acid-binding protein